MTKARVKKVGKTGLENVVAVKSYLNESGWQVSLAGLYNYRKRGQLVSGPDGIFQKEQVDEFAKAFLKQLSTGNRLMDTEGSLRQQELKEKVRKLETENELALLKLGIKQGQYFRKDLVFIEFAARAGILEAGFKHRMLSKAADIIRLAEGNLDKINEFILAMNTIYDELINEYAQTKNFTVSIAGGDEED